MSKRSILVTLIAAVAAVTLAAAALSQIKRVAAPRLATVDGAQAYAVYCASCHGENAKGDGKAAPYLKTPVPDLTAIAARYGKFDHNAVRYAVEGRHSEEQGDMPHWSSVLSATYQDSGRGRVILNNVVRHLGTLQEPAR